MPITTLAQVKTILGLDNTKDAQITALLPLVELDYISIRNRPFDEGRTLKITAGAAATGNITVTVEFIAFPVELTAGNTAAQVARKIYNALRGGYLFDVAAVGDTLTLASRQNDTDIAVAFADTDATGATAAISEILTLYPDGSEMTAIDMIGFRLGDKAAGVQSQNLGDYSVSYSQMRGKYPAEITDGIKRFVRWL